MRQRQPRGPRYGTAAGLGLALMPACLGAPRAAYGQAPGFDIAPFALPNTPRNEIRFEEPRDIARLVVAFKGTPPAVELQYRQRRWPQYRSGPMPIERYAFMDRPFDFGWYPVDDHFGGSWRDAAIETTADGGTVAIAFRPLTDELPDMAKRGYDTGMNGRLSVRASY